MSQAMVAASGGRAMLERLRAKKAALSGGGGDIPRRGARRAPLSFSQQRLWFLDQLEPGSPRFNIVTALRMRGPLEPRLLRATLREIVRRHEILRTRFPSSDGEPCQEISESHAVPIEVVSLEGLEHALGEVHRLARREALRPFDLAGGPCFRCRLLRLRAGDHVLLLNMHQIVSDRWSRGVLVMEMNALHEALRRGLPSGLAEPAIQYADFAAWQRESHGEGAFTAQLEHWRRELAPPRPVLELPADRARPAIQSWRGRLGYTVIAGEDVAALQALGGDGTTLFMLLVAGVAALLQRLTGQDEVVFGTPIANRNRREIRELLGFFLNLLPLRVRSGTGATFRQLLAEARRVALGAFAHQELPFERLIDALGVERDLGRHPLFDMTLVLQNAPMEPPSLHDLELGLIEIDPGISAFDLSLFFWETDLYENLGAGLSLSYNYATDLFDRSTVERWVGGLKRLLHEVARQPDRPLAELDLLAPAERHQMLVEWNPPASAEPGSTLLEHFNRRAERSADGIAIEQGEEHFSYAHLARLAAAWAERLAAVAEPGSVVAVPAERAAWRVVAWLAVLAAGCTVLPLDLDESPARRDELLRRARVRAGLDGSPTRTSWPETLERIPLEPIRVASDSATNTASFRAAARALAPAALLFTSGSTGAPRGVLVRQEALARLALETVPFPIEPGCRVALSAHAAFDAALFETWSTLLAGGTLVGLGEPGALAGEELRARLATLRIEVLFVPAALLEVISESAPEAFDGLEHLWTGGAPLHAHTIERLRAAGGPRHLHNLYGLTEGTVLATAWSPSGGVEREPPPVGRPLAGSPVFVVDRRGLPVPLGAVGEVLLGGPRLADGYFEDARATAERFVPDALSGARGGRLLRTGDLGRWRSDGVLELHGRRDRQLKLAGVRVEPGEIEAVLAARPGVAAAHVAAHDGRLLAYLASEDDDVLVRLRDELPGLLPAALRPSRLIRLPSWPLDARGKLDASRLPAPESAPLPAPATVPPPAAVPANGGLEHQLRELITALLGVPAESGDDFFALGGTSLDASRLAARVRKMLGLDLTTRAVFELRSAAAMARKLGRGLPRTPRQHSARELAPNAREEAHHVASD